MIDDLEMDQSLGNGVSFGSPRRFGLLDVRILGKKKWFVWKDNDMG